MVRSHDKFSFEALRKQSFAGWAVMGWNILAGAFVCAAAAVAVFGVSPKASQAVDQSSAVTAPQWNIVNEQPWAAFDAYEPYFSSRDIFVSEEEKALAATLVPVAEAGVSAVSWGDGYQLAGVVVDQNPSALIKVANPPGVVTLTVGQPLGDAVLKKVEANRAVFEYQGQEVMLTLKEGDRL